MSSKLFAKGGWFDIDKFILDSRRGTNRRAAFKLCRILSANFRPKSMYYSLPQRLNVNLNQTETHTIHIWWGNNFSIISYAVTFHCLFYWRRWKWCTCTDYICYRGVTNRQFAAIYENTSKTVTLVERDSYWLINYVKMHSHFDAIRICMEEITNRSWLNYVYCWITLLAATTSIGS